MVRKRKDPHAVALGKRGGEARAKKLSAAELSAIGRAGAAARMRALTAAERSRIAKIAVEAREQKRKQRAGKGGSHGTRA